LVPDEIAISAAFHRRTGLGVGDHLTLQVPGPGVLRAVFRSETPPDVPSTPVRVTIVGIAQGSFWRGDVQTTYAFWKAHQEDLTPSSRSMARPPGRSPRSSSGPSVPW
jgi:hypothetical protein